MSKKVKEIQLRRPPVITIMGHVDHGKTSILDAIKGSDVVAKEAGGITQNITAFDINFKGRHLTLIDTPGHELFSNMRKSGVLMTDLVLLIIAVDDGIMPQTREVIQIIKDNNLKTIVVFNKIDLPSNNITKIKSDLAREGILLEGYGGDIPFQEVSARSKIGIDDLIDLIFLQYDLLEDIYTPENTNSLVVLESYKDAHVGNISLCIVQNGEVNVGEYIYSLQKGELGKIRSLKNDKMESIKEATESAPIYLSGQKDFLNVGDTIIFSKSKLNIEPQQTNLIEQIDEFNEEDLFAEKSEVKKLSIILKSDTVGSLEAIVSALESIELNNINIDIFKKDLGDISEEDLNTAKDTHSIIIGFNIKASPRIKKIAQSMHIVLMIYDILYRLVEDVKDAAESLIPPEYIEIDNGRAEIKQVITLSNKSIVLGSLVFEGKILNSSKCKILRKDEVIFEGKITSLKHLKNEVKEVATGTECGIIVSHSIDAMEGDIIVSYIVDKV
jgi:translation initiation factor IF-2